jgi:hypothetical protein
MNFDGETTTPDTSFMTESSAKKEPVQEFLLCFRPMRDGDKKVDESLRLVVSTEASKCEDGVITSSSGSTGEQGNSEKTSAEGSDSKNNSTSSGDAPRKRPPKNRSFDIDLQAQGYSKKRKTEGGTKDDTEKSVVESLMLMNKSQTSA